MDFSKSTAAFGEDEEKTSMLLFNSRDEDVKSVHQNTKSSLSVFKATNMFNIFFPKLICPQTSDCLYKTIGPWSAQRWSF